MPPKPLHLRVILTLVLAISLGPTQAQVFIPSVTEREALNTLLPGVVDEAGIMDTLHPAINSLVHASVFIPYEGPSVSAEFIGFRYLHAMTSLSISVYIDSTGSFSLNGLPDNLNYLWVLSFAPTNLNTLPASMDTLWVGGLGGVDGIDVQINAMPDSLKHLFVHSVNHFDWHGPFHIGIFHVGSWMNDTFELPQSSIDSLFLETGGSVSVDLSAAEIQHASLDGYQYSQIVLPTQMSYLRIRPNYYSQPICLPLLPDDLDTLILDNMAYGFCLANWPSSLTNCFINDVEVGPADVIFCSILNSSCPGIGSGMNGHAFVDQTGDGVYGTGDLPLSFVQVHTDPDSYITGCDDTGYWYLDIPPGSYSILPSSMYPYIQSITPAQHFANLAEQGELDTLNDFAVTLEPNIKDLQAHLVAQPARPGFDNRLFLSCKNYGTIPMNAQLVLNYGPDQSWIASSIPPSGQVANTATWDLGLLAVGNTTNLTVDLHTGSTVALGTPLNYQLIVQPTLGDETPEDNMVMLPETVVGSFDPNDKLVDPPSMAPVDIQTGDQLITYTIRFQNTGTYMADRVVIADSLPEGLQLASIQELASSHAHHWYVDHGVLYVIYKDINLPDSTSDEANSHGFFRFSILPETGLSPGADIVNVANIVFDYNTPIATPPALFHVDDVSAVEETITTTIRVHPNPAQDWIWVTLPGWSGVASYAVQDLSGRRVLNGHLNGDHTVDVRTLQAGPYVLTVLDQEGSRTSRFMKLK